MLLREQLKEKEYIEDYIIKNLKDDFDLKRNLLLKMSYLQQF